MDKYNTWREHTQEKNNSEQNLQKKWGWSLCPSRASEHPMDPDTVDQVPIISTPTQKFFTVSSINGS